VTPTTFSRGRIDFDAFSAAVALALVAGALAIAAPFLLALTAALTALAMAAWVVGHVRQSTELRPLRVPLLGFAVVGSGATAFLALPTDAFPVRGLVLASSLLPLWWFGRARGPDHGVRTV